MLRGNHEMILGVDARQISSSMNGIGRYQRELFKELRELPIRINIYSDRTVPADLTSLQTHKPRLKNRNSRIFSQLWGQTALPFLAKKQKINVFWGPAHRLPIFLAPEISTVLTIHDLVWMHASQTMRKSNLFLEKLLTPNSIRRADLIITVSKNSAEDLCAAFPFAHEKIRIIPLGTAIREVPEELDLEVAFGITKPYLLFVGTLEPRKNLRRLIKAFSLLPIELRTRYQLVIVGGKGWGDVNVKSSIKEMNIEDSCILTDHVSDIQLAKLYSSAYCLTLPSLYEGFGLPIIEAQSYGVPVLTSQLSSMPEVGGDGALYIDPYEVDDITNGLLEILGNTTRRNNLAANAKLNAKRFSWRNTAEKTFDVFVEAFQKVK